MKPALFGLLALAAQAAFASDIYFVTVDTSSVSGTAGAVYLQFTPGLNADLAMVAVTDFLIAPTGGLTGIPITNGDVSGSLSSPPLVLTNTDGLNDYLNFLTFGDSMSFQLEFAWTAPLVGDAGSQFSFGLTASDGLSPILTTDPNGFAGTISYDNTGLFTVTTFSEETTIESAVPEPASMSLCLGAALAWFVPRMRRRRPGI